LLEYITIFIVSELFYVKIYDQYMPKYTTVIVKKTQNKLGVQGEILKLAPGYVFNYLLPNNLVELASKNKIKHYQMFDVIAKKKKEDSIHYANKIKQQITKIEKISIIKKIGDQNNIFGSINSKDIINEILAHTGYELDKKYIEIPLIKNPGLFILKIKTLDDQEYNISIQIIPQNI